MRAAIALRMTSQNAPSPYVATANYATWAPFQAFNFKSNTGSVNEYVTSQIPSAGTPVNVRIDLGSPVTLVEYGINGSSFAPSGSPKTFKLFGSLDATNWTEVDSRTNETGWTAGELRSYTIATPGSYRYYELRTTANDGNVSWFGFAKMWLIVESSPGGVGGGGMNGGFNQ